MSEKLLSVVGLNKSYGGFPALKEVGFTLESGQVKAIMGPNGAGKSTLLEILSGELEVSSGSVVFTGRDITDYPVDRTCRLGISYLPQRPSNFPGLTVKENVRGAAQTGLITKKPGDERTTKELLDLVGLENRAGNAPGELPYGEKRLLDLAMALATKPKLLLADEPTAGVDSDASGEILDLLRDLTTAGSGSEFGLDGLVFTEHDHGVLFDLPDEIGFLRSGELIVEGTPEQLKRHGAVQEYLVEHQILVDDKPGSSLNA
jgi:branched-chain amino acid transport system ATP-binding protein